VGLIRVSASDNLIEMTDKPPLAEPEVFVLADHALNEVVARIKDDQWAMEMPPSFATA
jgi:hypothetical protein